MSPFKHISDLSIEEAESIKGGYVSVGPVSSAGCGWCADCGCSPWDPGSTRAAFSLGRTATPSAQGCDTIPQKQSR